MKSDHNQPEDAVDPQTRTAIAAECGQLSHAFACYVDSGQAAQVAQLFLPDGTFTRRGETLRGREELLRSLASRSPRVVSRHLCSTTCVEVLSADEARGVTYFELHKTERPEGAADGPLPLRTPETIGEYHDEFKRTPAGWRIRSRVARGVFRRAEGA